MITYMCIYIYIHICFREIDGYILYKCYAARFIQQAHVATDALPHLLCHGYLVLLLLLVLVLVLLLSSLLFVQSYGYWHYIIIAIIVIIMIPYILPQMSCTLP